MSVFFFYLKLKPGDQLPHWFRTRSIATGGHHGVGSQIVATLFKESTGGEFRVYRASIRLL